ncbi:MAG TPA: hypothetical protein PLQ12_03150 [Candidatus Defluviicoccus seviourii]|nr:hypothetical protein [Candidatus Defluviicoccus seviourii]
MKGDWSYRDLAQAIGLRALGEEIGEIAIILGRSRDEVAKALAFARTQIRAETWIEDLLAPTERPLAPAKPPAPAKPARPPAPTKLPRQPEKIFRNWRPAPVIHRMPDIPANVTAAFCGDPSPERSALNQRPRS